MTFTVPRKPLLDELALLTTVAGARNTVLPVLHYVKLGLVDGLLTLTASNVDVSLVTQVEASGDNWEGCLHCAQLYNLVKLLYEDTLTFRINDNGSVELKAGKSKHLLPAYDLADFPTIQQAEANQLTLPAPLFNQMLDSVAFAAMVPADDLKPSQYRFTGVSLIVKDGQLRLTGTNIARLASVVTQVDADMEMETIIPSQAVAALASMKQGDINLSITDNLIHVRNGVRQLSALRLNDDKFPDWQAMFPAGYAHQVQVASGELGAAIKRTMLTQNEGRFVIIGQRWTWANDELLIETKGGDKGKSDEVLSVVGLNGSSVTLGMNGRQVLEGLSLLGEQVTMRFNADTFVVELAPAESAIDFRYYINTVSLRHWQ